jgi:lysophospholipase L1-like esterase
LETAHLGKVGWASWDFAFDDWEDCNEDGFRQIGNHSVKCGHGIGCEQGRDPLLRLSDIAADAAQSDVTLVTTWFNDHKQPLTHPPFKCFNGENIQQANTSLIAVPNILKLVRAIRALSNKTWVVIMAEYPMTQNLKVMDSSVEWVHELNEKVKAAISEEPRTLFVDYHMPAQGLEMYQKANYGHPNCRGSKVMAHGILETLYQEGVLARSLRLEGQVAPLAGGAQACGNLTGPACHTSALCWVDPEDRNCKSYGVGSKEWYVKDV